MLIQLDQERGYLRLEDRCPRLVRVAARTSTLPEGAELRYLCARVLDQLLYKWPHSREVVWPVLAEQYAKLVRSGWDVCEDDVRRDVALLFGGAFEAFMEK